MVFTRLLGDGSRLWLWGINMGSYHQQAPSIPEAVFCVFQLAFAIITAALICGSFADRLQILSVLGFSFLSLYFRMRFGPMLFFMVCWHTAVYCPIAHWNCTRITVTTRLLISISFISIVFRASRWLPSPGWNTGFCWRKCGAHCLRRRWSHVYYSNWKSEGKRERKIRAQQCAAYLLWIWLAMGGLVWFQRGLGYGGGNHIF